MAKCLPGGGDGGIRVFDKHGCEAEPGPGKHQVQLSKEAAADSLPAKEMAARPSQEHHLKCNLGN